MRNDPRIDAPTDRETITLATVDGGKVHMAMAWQHGAPSCDRREAVTAHLAVLPDGSLNDTVAAVVAAGVRPSRLCGSCFGLRTRKAVADAYAAARAA